MHAVDTEHAGSLGLAVVPRRRKFGILIINTDNCGYCRTTIRAHDGKRYASDDVREDRLDLRRGHIAEHGGVGGRRRRGRGDGGQQEIVGLVEESSGIERLVAAVQEVIAMFCVSRREIRK